jgi:GNAT superfamily N-acetyltransferase
MKIERLSVENLREGIYCPHGKKRNEEVYTKMEAWLAGDVLRGQIARTDDGQPIGFIIYGPAERMPVDVDGGALYMVQCLFVKPEYQGNNVGRTLIEAALADATEMGAPGLAAQGMSQCPDATGDFIPGSFFTHIGMTAGDTRGKASLYFACGNSQTDPPRYLDRKFIPPADDQKVRVDVLDCGLCYTAVTNREIVKQVAEQLGGEVSLVLHDQSTREAVVDKGMSSGVFIDGKLTFFEGHVTEQDVWNAIHVAISARRAHQDR